MSSIAANVSLARPASPAISRFDQWGPFVLDLDPGERIARLRCLRAVVHLLAGHRGLDLQVTIRTAERAPTIDALHAVLSEIDRLTPNDRRHALASYCAITRNDRASVDAE